jgi:DNA polymerase-4
MDAFYASVEERENPALRGQPVIVGGPRDARGVVSAANYAARKFGVHSAMPLRVASRLCPDGVFLPGRMKLYAEASRAVFAIFHRYSPAVEPLSIDEAFLDATGCERLYGGPVELAKVIRAAIREEVSLTASVGVAPNKFIAKIASDLDKPDGLVVVPPGEVEAFLAPLPVERMWGIGPKGAQELRARGIRTFADLAGANLDGPLVTQRAPKSVGHETTFMENVTDEDVVHRTLVSLTDRVAGRLRHHGLRARTVTLKVRYAPFRTFTRRVTLPAPTCATTDLLETVLALWKDKAPEHGVPVRLLGVSTSGFSAQATLFAAPEAPRREALDNAVDRVREKFGTAAVRRASVMRDG